MTEVDRLRQRLEQMRRDGLRNINIFWGDAASTLSLDERAGAVNKLLDAIAAGKTTPIDLKEWDKVPKVDVREWVNRLNAEKCDPEDLEAISE